MMGRRSLLPSLVSLLGALALREGSSTARAQAPPNLPTFSSEVELITVDAVVLDSAGRPVAGLGRDDFVVTEDGRPQEIVSFEPFVLEPPPEAPAPPATPPVVASNAASAGGNGRAFAIIIDDLRTPSPQAAGARSAAAAFMDRAVHDGDEVTLGTSSGEVWWNARVPEGRPDLLALLQRVKGRGGDAATYARMSDYEAYRIANYEDSPAMNSALPSGPSGSVADRAAAQASEAMPGSLGAIKERVKRRWASNNLCDPTACDGMVRGWASDLDAQRRDRTRLTLQSVRRGLEALAAVHGRKSLLLISPGFLEDSALDLRGIAATSREANTAVYFIDVRGLVAQGPGYGGADDVEHSETLNAGDLTRERTTVRFEESVLASAGAQTLADDTGGFSVRNTNDLAGGVERIADESRVFYLLGFHPPPGKSAGQWRKLRVEVRRPGLAVRARRGYSLRAEAAARPGKKEKAPAVDAAVVRALDSAHDEAGIPLRAMAYVFEPRSQDATRVLVAAEFDASRAGLPPKGGAHNARLEFSVVVTHRDTGRTFRDDGALEVSAAAGQSPGWRAFTREFELPPGVAQARVVVRAPAGDATGAVTQRFEVPGPGALRLSTPILTDRLEGTPGQARPQPALAVHRTFAPGGRLYCQFEVFGAARAAPAGPRVSAGLALRTSDGRLVREAAPTPIAADPYGRLVRLIGMTLDGMAAGPYDLVLDVRDEVSGARVERHEAFALGPETASR